MRAGRYSPEYRPAMRLFDVHHLNTGESIMNSVEERLGKLETRVARYRNFNILLCFLLLAKIKKSVKFTLPSPLSSVALKV